VDPGYAEFQPRTLQTSLFTSVNYTQRVAAQITAMPYHSGGTKGQFIELIGTGFSQDTTEYECTVAGQSCTVQNLDTTKLTVKIPSLNAGNTVYGALLKDPTAAN
jgi:hypothetical protein